MGCIYKRSWWFDNEIYTYALLIVPHLLCKGSSVFATGGGTCRSDFLESPVQQSAFVPDCQGVTGNDLLKSIRVRDKKNSVSLCTEYGERRWTNTNISEICLLWKEAGDTDKDEKIRKNILPNVTSKIPAVFFCRSTEGNGTTNAECLINSFLNLWILSLGKSQLQSEILVNETEVIL